MSDATYQRLFGWSHAFDDPATAGMTAGVAVLLALAPVIQLALSALGLLSPATRKELWTRYVSWLVMAPLMAGPVLLGAAWTIAAVCVLSLLCYREFARATGLSRERVVSSVVVAGIILVGLAVADHWYDLFVALFPLMAVLIAAVAVSEDQPKGYIQRAGLGVFAFAFFGSCLGHLGYFANDSNYRPVILMILLTVELNDVFAYVCGKTLGRRTLAPQTSPKKTWAGAIGAVILTSPLTAGLGHLVFRGSPIDHWPQLTMLGLIISVGGQLGDLMLSAIKRDLGIKDFAATIPGHGGLLDRVDSLVLVAPAVFHYVGYFQGVGLTEQARLFVMGR